MANTHYHITGRFSTVEELERYLHQNHSFYNRYLNLEESWRKRFQDFMLGKRTLPLTYDPFFKRIFNPDVHPDRLSRLISSVIGQPVQVVNVLNRDDVLLKGYSVLIMDILVRLSDGSLTAIEIQKIAMAFPLQRISCYSADLLLREYERLKAQNGKKFVYSDMKKVYSIVIFEETHSFLSSSQEHRAFQEASEYGVYLHHGKIRFDPCPHAEPSDTEIRSHVSEFSGLKLDLLQDFYLIALDVFKKNEYAKSDNELTMWLSLLATETVEEADLLIGRYPELEDVFKEMSEYMHNPEEVLTMYSEALKVGDENTVRYMMDYLGDELKDLQNENSELKDENLAIIKTLIQSIKQSSGSKDFAIEKLLSDCGKSQEEAEALVDTYWFDVVK